MSASKGIRAGRAFVELFADDKRLVRGLKRASAKMKSWGTKMTSLGAKAMAAGGAMMAPLLGSVKSFMSAGDALDKMSSRVGVSVEFLGQLGHAAALGGTDLAALEAGIRRMQRTAYDATRGLSTAKDAFAALGVNVRGANGQLKGTEQLYMESVAALSRMSNETQKAALASTIFGRSGTAMLPMLKDGTAGMAAMMQEAQRLGLVMSGEDAQAAATLTDCWTRLVSTLKMVSVQVGAALAPSLTDLSKRVLGVITPVIDWIKSNGQLIVNIMKIAAVVTAAGAVLVGLGSTLALAGIAIGGLATIISGTTTTLGGIASAFLALVSPIGIVASALVGLGGYFLYVSGIGKQVLSWLGQKFTALKDTAQKAWSGIADALAAGDISLAARILWLSLKVAWQTGLAWLSGLWIEFKGFWADGVMGLAVFFNDAIAKIKSTWVDAIGFLKKKWLEFSNSSFSESMADLIAPIVAVIEGVSVDDVRKNLKEDFAYKRKAQPGQVEDIDAQTRAKKQEIESDRQDTQDQLAEDARRRKLHESSQSAQGQAELDDARHQWQAALDLAAKKRTAKEEADLTIEEPKLAETVAGLAGGGLSFDLNKLSSKGTFNAMATRGLSSGGPMEKVARATEATAANTKRLVKKATEMRFA